MAVFKILNRHAESVKTSPTVQSALKAARGPLAFTALFSLASNLLYLSLPIYTQQIYGRVLISQSLGTLLVLTVGILVVFCVSAVLDYLRSQVMVNFSLEFDRQVSGPAFTTLFDAVVQRDRTTRSQALRDIDAVRQLLSGPAVATLFDLPWMPVFIFILFVIDPVIGFVTLGGGVVLVALTVAQNYFTRDKLRAASDEAIKGYAFTDAALRNGEVVRAMGMLPHLAAPWGKHRETALELSTVAQERGAMFSHATKLVRMIIQILIIAVGAALVIEQKIPSTMLFANMILASRALMPIQGLVGSFGPLTNGLQALARLNLLLGSYQPPERRTALPKPKGHIVVDRLSYAAPGSDVLILKAISLELAPGEVLGIAGPSGSGKSTLARLMVGVWKPLNGLVRLDGVNIYNWDRDSIGEHVGYLPQDVELFSGTVRANIARFHPAISDADVIRAATLAGAHDLIVQLPKGYDTELGEGGGVLSAGQRQLVGLARAIVGSPSLVVLDEPNASLDNAGEMALARTLKRLRERGVTVVIVSHKPNIFRAADKMAILKAGALERFGPTEAVLKSLNIMLPGKAETPKLSQVEAKK